jgi:uncharacterized protein
MPIAATIEKPCQNGFTRTPTKNGFLTPTTLGGRGCEVVNLSGAEALDRLGVWVSWMDLALLAAVGCGAGLLAGLLGIGGGLLIVPVLRYLGPHLGLEPDVIMHVAVATSAAVIVPTAITSGRAHWKRGAVDSSILWLWGPAMAVGSLATSLSGRYWSTEGLSLVFGIAAMAMALNLILGRGDLRLADRLPPRAAQGGLAAGIGAVSAVMGIGGGAIATTFMTLFNVPIHRAVGTAAMLGVFVGAPALVGWIIAGWGQVGPPTPALGYVSLPIAVTILPTMLLLAPVGVRLAHRLPAAKLRKVFGVFLFFAAFGILTKSF